MSDVDLVQRYRALVLEYEDLDEQVDDFLAEHAGSTEEMSTEDLAHYRDLARRRDEVHNQMKALERQIFQDD